MDTLTVEQLAAVLQEPNVRLLRQVLRTLGPERCAAILADTLSCEASGGMLTKDGTRRRTPGGVFFQLVKAQTTRQERNRLFFRPISQPHRASVPIRPQAHPQSPTWAEVHARSSLLEPSEGGRANRDRRGSPLLPESRLGRIEKHILTWGYRQHRDGSQSLAKAGAMLSYAREYLKLNVPARWSKRNMDSFTDAIRKAMKGMDEPEIDRQVSRLHASFSRALKNLEAKGLIYYSQSSKLSHTLRRRFTWWSGYILTKEGNKIAKDILLGESKIRYKKAKKDLQVIEFKEKSGL